MLQHSVVINLKERHQSLGMCTFIQFKLLYLFEFSRLFLFYTVIYRQQFCNNGRKGSVGTVGFLDPLWMPYVQAFCCNHSCGVILAGDSMLAPSFPLPVPDFLSPMVKGGKQAETSLDVLMYLRVLSEHRGLTVQMDSLRC